MSSGFPGVQPCLVSSITLCPQGRGSSDKGKAGESSPLQSNETLRAPSAEHIQQELGGKPFGCGNFCLRQAKHSRSISRKRLFWSELQNTAFAQLNSPAYAFSLRPRQLSGRRFLPAHPSTKGRAPPHSQLVSWGRGSRGFPSSRCLCLNHCQATYRVKWHIQGSPHGCPGTLWVRLNCVCVPRSVTSPPNHQLLGPTLHPAPCFIPPST